MLNTMVAAAVAARNVILGSNLASLRMLGNPRALVGYANEALFLYGSQTRTRGLKERHVFEVLGGAETQDISLGALSAKKNWIAGTASYTVDLVNLCLACRLLRPKRVFEIGTLRGYTTLHLALNTDPDARIFTLDLPPGHSDAPALATTAVDDWHVQKRQAIARQYFHGTAVEQKVTMLQGDSARFDFSPYRGTIDLFFIDGAHSYEYVKSDTLRALECSHPGSVIAWHDFGRAGVNGVSRWLRELAREHEVFSVPGSSLAFMVVK